MAEIFPCPPKRLYWEKRHRCNGAPDCLPDNLLAPGTFQEMVCDALLWNAPDRRRWTEIWTPDRQRKIVRITGRWASVDRLSRCGLEGKIPDYAGSLAPGDSFTVDIPGIQDIFKVKNWDSPDLRRERFERYKTARGALPDFLSWLPPVLTTLDNIQDMIFTGLALAIPLIRRLPTRLLPGVGWILLVNDILNALT